MRRRGFLVAGAAAGSGLLVGCGVSPRARLGEAADFAASPGEVALNAWLKIAEDGRVTVAAPRAEMGQGVHTALALLVAEELEADWARVAIQPTAPSAPRATTPAAMAAGPMPADFRPRSGVSGRPIGATRPSPSESAGDTGRVAAGSDRT